MDEIQSKFRHDPVWEAQEMRWLAVENLKKKRITVKRKSQVFVKDEDAEEGMINLAKVVEKEQTLED